LKNKKALLVHIIEVPRLYVILLEFCVKEFDLVAIAILTISLDTSAVHPNAPFTAEVYRVSAKKP
jgi:hypothetical protein